METRVRLINSCYKFHSGICIIYCLFVMLEPHKYGQVWNALVRPRSKNDEFSTLKIFQARRHFSKLFSFPRRPESYMTNSNLIENDFEILLLPLYLSHLQPHTMRSNQDRFCNTIASIRWFTSQFKAIIECR